MTQSSANDLNERWDLNIASCVLFVPAERLGWRIWWRRWRTHTHVRRALSPPPPAHYPHNSSSREQREGLYADRRSLENDGARVFFPFVPSQDMASGSQRLQMINFEIDLEKNRVSDILVRGQPRRDTHTSFCCKRMREERMRGGEGERGGDNNRNLGLTSLLHEGKEFI